MKFYVIKQDKYANRYLDEIEGKLFKEDQNLFINHDETGIWWLYDIPTGLYVVRGKTRKKLMEAWESRKDRYYDFKNYNQSYKIFMQRLKELLTHGGRIY